MLIKSCILPFFSLLILQNDMIGAAGGRVDLCNMVGRTKKKGLQLDILDLTAVRDASISENRETSPSQRKASKAYSVLEKQINSLKFCLQTLEQQNKQENFNTACINLTDFCTKFLKVIQKQGFLHDDITRQTPQNACALVNALIDTLKDVAGTNQLDTGNLPHVLSVQEGVDSETSSVDFSDYLEKD